MAVSQLQSLLLNFFVIYICVWLFSTAVVDLQVPSTAPQPEWWRLKDLTYTKPYKVAPVHN